MTKQAKIHRTESSSLFHNLFILLYSCLATRKDLLRKGCTYMEVLVRMPEYVSINMMMFYSLKSFCIFQLCWPFLKKFFYSVHLARYFWPHLAWCVYLK